MENKLSIKHISLPKLVNWIIFIKRVQNFRKYMQQTALVPRRTTSIQTL